MCHKYGRYRFSPKEWQTAEIPSSLNPKSIDQVEDREMAGWNKRRTEVTGSFTCLWRIDTVPMKRSDPRKALQPRTQTPDDLIPGFFRG
jgi:hypothetical protein